MVSRDNELSAAQNAIVARCMRENGTPEGDANRLLEGLPDRCHGAFAGQDARGYHPHEQTSHDTAQATV
jgi:hypothetical protein